MYIPAVNCIRLFKSFGSDIALNDLTISLDEGEVIVVLGPSGCGKTTTLRLIAGFEIPDSGEIEVFGRVLTSRNKFVPPDRRRIGMVFQDFALFPHLNVLENVAYGVNAKNEGLSRVLNSLMITHLDRFQERMPHELSGGQQQRVALARALAPNPEVMLLDEPFSNLDATLREEVRKETRDTIKKTGVTAVFVTHSQEEAMFMGDKVAVMNEGRLEQFGTPSEVFNSPSNEFVAKFMGVAEFLPADFSSGNLRTELGDIAAHNINQENLQNIHVMVRPHDILIEPVETGNGVIKESVFQGPTILYKVSLISGKEIQVIMPHTNEYENGTHVRATLTPGHHLNCFSGGKRLS